MREMLLYLGQISTEKSLGTGKGMLIDSVLLENVFEFFIIM